MGVRTLHTTLIGLARGLDRVVPSVTPPKFHLAPLDVSPRVSARRPDPRAGTGAKSSRSIGYDWNSPPLRTPRLHPWVYRSRDT
jgi:hypothetical protein